MKHSPEFLQLVKEAKSRIRQTTPDEVKRKLDRGDKFLLVDCREDNEWDKGHIEGAIHLSRGIIERDIENIVHDKKNEVIIYCGGGYRSALAADNLQKMSYTNVISMDGGWRAWNALGYPTE
jgi:rhodanese-related sulfurtransferase